MIRRSTERGTESLVVTHPLRDWIASGLMVVVAVVVGSHYSPQWKTPAEAAAGIAIFFVIPVLSSFLVIRTKVVVTCDAVRQRVIISRTWELPKDVVVERENRLVRLTDGHGTVLYTFPSGLSNNGELEYQLGLMFSAQGP